MSNDFIVAKSSLLQANPINKFNFISQPTTTVTIGEDMIPFHIHKEVLSKSSNWFEQALSEADEMKIENNLNILDISTETFSHYVQWAYSHRIVVTDPVPSFELKFCDLEDEGREKAYAWVKDQFDALVNLAIYANRLSCEELSNDIATALVDLSEKGKRISCDCCPYGEPMLPRQGTIVRAYAHLPDKSHITSILTQLVAHSMEAKDLETAAAEWMPEAMRRDLLLKYRDVHGRLDLPSLADGKCRFHEHGEGIPLCEEMKALYKESVRPEEEVSNGADQGCARC